MAVRRSSASTSVIRAAISGRPARSALRNTTPWPIGAGRNVAWVAAPVCSPVPDSDCGCWIERLALGILVPAHERLEVVDDLGQPVQRRLGAQVFAVLAGGIPRYRGAVGDVADHAALDRDPYAAADGDVVGKSRLAGQEDVVADVGTAGDAHHGGDEAAGPEPDVVR